MDISEKELERLIEIKVKQVLAEMLGIHNTPRQTKYLPTSKAWTALGYQNQDQLYDAVNSGLLRVGTEVQDRRKPKAKLPKYYFNIEACLQRLKELPEKRG